MLKRSRLTLVFVLCAALLMTVAYSGGRLSSQGIAAKAGVTEITLKDAVDPYRGSVALDDLGLRAEVEAVRLEKDGQNIPVMTELGGNRVRITSEAVRQYGGNLLELAAAYTLKLFTADGGRYVLHFKTDGLPALTDNGARRVVFIPAMPERGFHWPYYLVLPSDKYQGSNRGEQRYLLVDTNNTGSDNQIDQMLVRTYQGLVAMNQMSMSTAERLWTPMLMPAFPRPRVAYTYEGESNQFYTHALDRDTATLHLKLENPKLRNDLTNEIKSAGFEVNTLLHLDQQLDAMIQHAIGYLNQYDHAVHPQKVFLQGYSASGQFNDRFAALHPERVRAVVSGATLDDMLLPLAEYKGEQLIYPIGTYDYEAITGKAFDLQRHNQVARLVHMGDADTNNVLPYTDVYGDRERNLITRLWGTEVLPRAQALTELYGQAGGKGIFILDKGTGHSASREMMAYAIAFLAANRKGDAPVYPIPENAVQLKYTLFE